LHIIGASAATDLPLKTLVRENGKIKVKMSYNDPKYIKERHALARELVQNNAAVETLAQ
jgi:uncharacterized protein (DUF302 family)